MLYSVSACGKEAVESKLAEKGPHERISPKRAFKDSERFLTKDLFSPGPSFESHSNLPDLYRPRVDIQAAGPVDRVKTRIGQDTHQVAAQPHGELQHTAQRRDVLYCCLIAAIGAKPYPFWSNTPTYSLGRQQRRARDG